MSIIRYFINGKELTKEEFVKYLRDKYTKNVPLGYTAKEIQNMPAEDLLDMDYFLNE